MNSRLRSAGFLWAVAVSSVLLWQTVEPSAARAQDFAPGLMYVVVPDSERPLAFVDETDPPITSYLCLNNLDSVWGYYNIYKPYNHSGSFNDGIYIVVFPDSVDLDTVAAAYLASGCFDDVYRMVRFQPHVEPDDPLYLNGADTIHRQWALDVSHIRAQQAWDITTGDPSVVVAIIDESFFWEHPDIKGNVWINPAEDINHNGTFDCWASTVDSNGVHGDLDSLDNDGNGYYDDVVGLKFIPGDSAIQTFPDVRGYEVWDPTIPIYHGTIAASVISARTNNDQGMAGIAGGWGGTPGVKLMLLAAPGQHARELAVLLGNSQHPLY